MASSKLIAGLFLALALLVANTPQPSGATRAEPTPSPAPSSSLSEPPATPYCISWFMVLTPCMDFLTDASVAEPSSGCCKGLEWVVDAAPMCLCYARNGEIDNLMPANTDFSRVADLPSTCGVTLPVEALSECETEPVPPLIPPSPPAA
ncbi:hypothetical protein PAHAL_1G087500 [Panicum hallii]|uniref:Bifunctional inhibitor/plant lipid transfer protein/seed storage helical domain-containing protein n=1 Tax=Panicum hallii TaxID=206008 RepID=A0A2S3GN50_9POAL|nr:non-specific lipid transfer protein GPI-anchored 2-like [Panicum hallii]PAN04728.1 hypothetical protein PAHAL_1G087500 [Panicum hallii]